MIPCLPSYFSYVYIKYFSRTLKKIGEQLGFQYHPRLMIYCFNVKVICILFILCWEVSSFFSKTSRLQANTHKSTIYCSGMNDAEVDRILASSGFVKNFLHFKYLGVPICSRRISISDREKLIEKMMLKIRLWSSKHVFFVGRVQLINSVLISLHLYLAQVFILPKHVLHEIEKVCRAFLWSREYYSSKLGYVN